jgi:hypothetical protein
MDRKKEGGYSLMEVGLALSIGILLTGSAVYGYKALRDQSGDAAMRQKVQDLRVLVEELYAPSSAFPTPDTLRTAWKMRRPDDYKSSPWGGPVIGSTETNRGILSQTISDGATQYEELEKDSSTGGALHYIWIENAGAAGTAAFWDVTRGATVSATAYMVAGDKPVDGQGHLFFHVQSGR